MELDLGRSFPREFAISQKNDAPPGKMAGSRESDKPPRNGPNFFRESVETRDDFDVAY